jgi:hypothetical protein
MATATKTAKGGNGKGNGKGNGSGRASGNSQAPKQMPPGAGMIKPRDIRLRPAIMKQLYK